MKPWTLVLSLVLGLSGCRQANEDVRIRGELTISGYRLFLSPCDSSDIYWALVAPSSRMSSLDQRIKELRNESEDAPIIGEFRGKLREPGKFDVQTKSGRNVDGVLSVSQIVAVDLGSCEEH